jgi:hypothetical protein
LIAFEQRHVAHHIAELRRPRTGPTEEASGSAPVPTTDDAIAA